MSNVLPGKKDKPSGEVDTKSVYTRKLEKLNRIAQEALWEFVQHDIDDKEGLEQKRLAMHDAFTKLYNETANFSEQIMGVDFDIAYIRERLSKAEGEAKQQLEETLAQLEKQLRENLAEIWMFRVLAWLHQAAAASGPFIEHEHENKEKEALQLLAQVYTMLDRSFTAVPRRSDGTQKLRRVALGKMVYDLLSSSETSDEIKLAEIQGKNKIAEAEFFDEFLNDLIGLESTFRQAFNPFDELIWRDILYSFIYEHATDLYNEAIPNLEKVKGLAKSEIDRVKSWKSNTSGLCEVYLAMTYSDIASSQMRAGNLEDAAKLYQAASDAFGRAEKCFSEVIALEGNAKQAMLDKEHKKAQALFCRAEAGVKKLTGFLKAENREEAVKSLKQIFKDLRTAEKLAKTRELTGAIREDLRIFSFVESKLKKNSDAISGILDQIELATEVRREGLIQDVKKALDLANVSMNKDPSDSLDALREGLNSLGILLSLQEEDAEIRELRNRLLATLKHVKYVIQFQLSSQLQPGVKFMVSRILENLHAEDAARYYEKIGEKDEAIELMDLGKLAIATACATEAQIFAKQSEQWAFRAQMERVGTLQRLDDELSEFEDSDYIEKTIAAHDNTIERLKRAVAAFEAATEELSKVVTSEIRESNHVDGQIKQLKGVVLKFKGDLLRLEGAKSNFMAEYASKKGDKSKARVFYSQSSDMLREAVGSYTVAAQVFQQLGNIQAAQSIDGKAKTTDLIARAVWDSRQKLGRDEEPNYLGDTELAALYLGTTGQ